MKLSPRASIQALLALPAALLAACSAPNIENHQILVIPQAVIVSALTEVAYDLSTTRLKITGTLVGTTSTELTHIEFHRSLTCADAPIGAGIASQLSSSGIEVQVPSVGKSDLYARTNTDSGCQFVIQYDPLHAPPPPPSFGATTPTSPSRVSRTPLITGTPSALTALLKFYDDSSCSSQVGAGSPYDFKTTGVQLTLQSDQTSSIYVKAFEPFGNASACALLGQYTHTTVAPAAPVYTSVSPASPSKSSLTPTLKGTLSADSVTVNLYSDSACANLLSAGQKTDFESAGVQLTVTENSTTTIYARGLDAEGIASACTYLTTYVHDQVPPAGPGFSSTNPVSPLAVLIYPKVVGTAAADVANLVFYSDSGCTSQIGTGTRTEFVGAGVTVTIGRDTTTTIYSKALDVAGNASGCTYLTDFVNDSLPPDPPVFGLTIPASPNNSSTTPMVLGNVTADTATLSFFSDGDCTVPIGAGDASYFESSGLQVTVPPNQDTPIYAISYDGVGNGSGCTLLTYYKHSNQPALPPVYTASAPANPSNTSTTPRIIGSVDSSIASIKLYADSACSSGALLASGTRVNFLTSGILISVPANTSTAVYAKSTNDFGNDSSCVHMVDYVHTTIKPTPPVFGSITPTSPSNAAAPPLLQGLVSPLYAAGSPLPAASIKFFDSSDCVNTLGNGTVSAFVGAGAASPIYENATTDLYAQTLDAAGNRSACTYLTSYTQSAVPPGVPVFGSATPTTPSYVQSTTIKGTVAASSSVLAPTLVSLYKEPTCSIALASASVGIYQSVGIPITADNNATTTVYGQTSDVVGNLSDCNLLVNFVHSDAGPTGLTATVSASGKVNLIWNPDPKSTRYIVKRSPRSGGPYSVLSENVMGSAYQDLDISNGSTFYYVVAAANATGASLNSAEISAAVAVTPPSAPTSFVASPGAAAVTLSWSGSSQSMTYSLYRSLQSGGPYTRIASGILGSSYVDSARTNGVAYYYVVTASNPAGESPHSVEVSAVPKPLPSAPLKLFAQLDVLGDIHFSWSAPSYYSQFTVLCGATSGSLGTVAGSTTAQSLDWTPTELVSGGFNRRYCVVVANWGASNSAESNEVGLAVMGRPGISPTPGDGTVIVSLASADTYSTDFKVYRATNEAGPFSLIASSTSGSTDYVDSGLTNQTTYFYKAEAVYPGGLVGTPSFTSAATPSANATSPSNLAIAQNKLKQPVLSWSAPADYNLFNIWRAGSLGGPYVQQGTSGTNSYTETLSVPGIYYYKVTSSWGGLDSAATNIVSFRHGIVTGLAAIPSSASIALAWNNFAGASSYQVSRATQSGGPYTVLDAAVGANSFTDSTASANVGYYYVVSANFADGSTGQYSNEAVSMTTASGVPGGLSVTNTGTGSVTLTWGPVSGATRYYVYSSSVSGGPYSPAGSVNAPASTLTVNSLNSSTSYYFVVTAEVGGVESAYSSQVGARTVSTPGPPTLTLNSTNVQLDWGPLASAASYTIQRSTDFSAVTTLVTVPTPTTTYQDLGVVNGSAYYYRYRVNYAGGVSTPYSAWTSAITPGVTPPAPARPSLVSPITSTSMTLSWPGSASATSYNVKVGTASGGPYVTTQVYAPTYSMTALTAGTIYYIVVSALNGTLESADSPELAAAPMTAPTAPVAVVSGANVDLTWTAVTCNGIAATGYRIERSQDEVNFSTIAASVAGTSYTDATAASNTSYSYRHLALCGTARSAVYSSISNKVTLGIAPLAPVNLLAQASGGGTVNLLWVTVPNAVSYTVYRGTISSGPYSKIGTVTAPTTTYSETPALGTYYYVVRAVNASGIESADSNEAAISLGLSAPAGLVATAVSNSIQVSWSSVGGASTYTLRRSVAPAGPFGSLAVITAPTTSYVDTGVQNGVTYYYVVTSVSAGGLSSPDSAVASATAVTGAKIQVPVELTDSGLASSTGSMLFERTRTSLDSQAYDGTVSYAFEAIVTNAGGASGAVNLVDSSGAIVATLSVPAGTASPTRMSSAFVPNVGRDTYRVGLSATAATGDLTVLSARVLITQVAASRTRIYIPLLASASPPSSADAGAPVSTTNASNYYELPEASIYVRKTAWLSALEDYNAWELETVVSSSGGAVGMVGLYNVNRNMMIPETEAIFGGASLAFSSSPFDDGLSGFGASNEDDELEVAIKCVSGCASGNVFLHKAGLWVSLRNLDKAEIYFRNGLGHPGGSGSFPIDNARALIDLSKFSNPAVYFQGVANLIGGSSFSVDLASVGAADVGTGGLALIGGSSLNYSSASKTWARSAGALTISSGDRFLPYVNAGASAAQVIDSTVVIRIQR